MSVNTCMASLARQFREFFSLIQRSWMRNVPNPVGWVGGGWVGVKLGYWLSCSSCFSAKCRLIAKGCGFFVPKWVWLGIS